MVWFYFHTLRLALEQIQLDRLTSGNTKIPNTHSHFIVSRFDYENKRKLLDSWFYKISYAL